MKRTPWSLIGINSPERNPFRVPGIYVGKHIVKSITRITVGLAVLISMGTGLEELYCGNFTEISRQEMVTLENSPLQEAIKALQEGSSYEKQRAAIKLAASGEKSAVEPLIKALSDTDMFVRDFAARALGDIGDPTAVYPLIKALEDSNPLVERSSALALGKLGDSRAVDPLIKTLNSENYMARRAAAQALGELGDLQAVDPLIETLGDEDVYIQNGAATALTDIGKPAIPPLVNALSDWTLGPRVAEILKDLDWKPSSDLETIRFDVATRNKNSLLNNWEIAKKILLNDADNEDSRVAQNAVFALIGIGRNDVLEELVDILDRKGNDSLASAFLDCGNDFLMNAARNWAVQQNNELRQSDDPVIKWGQI